MIYQLKDYHFNTQTRTLQKGRSSQELTPKIFKLLLLLTHANGEVVSKKQILERVWAGRIVSETTLYKVVQRLRYYMGDDGESQAVIKTVHGEGYVMALRSKKLKAWRIWLIKLTQVLSE